MEQVLAALVVVALLAGGTWWQHRLSRGRMWDPLWIAFSMTTSACLFVVAGTVGYRLDQRSALLAGNRWADGVIWWQIGFGLVFTALAVVFWRAAIRNTDRRLGRG
jgi:hypothetical protein